MSTAGLRILLAASLLLGSTAFAQTPELRSATVQRGAQLGASHHEGVVEAVRQTLLTAQVAGAVQEIAVQAGDAVRAGQVLLRLDARAAEQTASASAAQVRAAQAVEQEAERELARQRQLLEADYISQAAFDRAEARHKAARAEAAALRAAADASRTQSDFYVLRAPYDGVVSAIPVSLGDMAMPGRPLLTLYDPSALRVSVQVPQAVAAVAPADLAARLELAGLDTPVTPRRAQWLPSVDPTTHTVELRLDLPADLRNVLPGTFARARLNLADGDDRLYIPREAVLRRAELTAVYVLDAQQRPRLRQVRLGPQQGDQVEVLTGLAAGERVALDPLAAGQLK
jgi:RND family efflux transporter MFP subunit